MTLRSNIPSSVDLATSTKDPYFPHPEQDFLTYSKIV